MENLGWGLQMTAVGMGLVFGLLAIAVGPARPLMRFEAAARGAVGRVRRSSRPSASRPSPTARSAAQVPVTPTVHGMDADLVAAIMIAVLAHKGVRRQQAAPAMRSYWPGSLLYASRWLASGRARQNRSWQRRGS